MESLEAEITPTIVFLCILFLCIALVVVLFTFFASRKLSKTELARKQLELSYQEDLLRQTLLAQEIERNRIAQDLHDEIGGKMNVINLHLQLLRNDFSIGSKAHKSISGIHQQGMVISENARRIAHNLIPPSLQSFGLKAALHEYFDQVNKTKAIQARLQTDSDLYQLTPEHQMYIFRIVQELINNSIQHGQATEAAFGISFIEELCCCSYTDNGKGFEMMAQRDSGIGMQNIKSRVQFMKGKLSMFSAPGQGFQLSFEFLWI